VAPTRNVAADKLERVDRLKRILKRILLAILLAIAAVYGGDGLVAKLRGTKAFSTVEVQAYYAVPLKNGKTEIMMLDPESRTCVRSLLPHFGYSPCWYLDGRKQQRINM
jgi:hypothetical protein